MFSLCCAIISSALISVLMRSSENRVHSKLGMFLANYTVCTLLALYFTLSEGLPAVKDGMGFAIGLGAVSGVLYLVSFVLLQTNISKNGVVMSSTFMKLGVLIPTIMAMVIFRERPRLTQGIGILLAVIAILFLHFEKGESEKAARKGLLLILLLCSGFTDACANIYDKLGSAQFKNSYLVITFFCALLCTAVLLIKAKEKVSVSDLLCGLLIGIPNYFSSRFLLGALATVPAVVVYPVFSVGTIVAITLAGVLLFREKLSTKKLIALGIILAALILLNV